MASIGKVALSLATGLQETTLALANFNFDFAMIKMEAPPEYQGLGNRLSKRRKLEAEEGLVHTAARQLGALFADELPPVPNLARVYGLRASEISANPVINPTGTALDGPLASHIGLDGTSLWAAATSGRGALQVHLLACILARVWSNPEAVSIWSELVTARKAQLNERLSEDQFHMGHLMASRIEIGLEKLAEWDASARAWLSAADKAKYAQQKQLMLIIDNIDLQVRSFPRLYDSVMNVWKKALMTMENIVSGVAQGVESPEMLLGLTSWHLYPDMAVLGDETRHVIQKDSLIPQGGLVTIGMHGSKARNETGITWTMPLAQMRYYGDPIHSTRSVGTKSLRISFDSVVLISMGSVISTWGSYASDLESLCNFWISLAARCVLEGSVAPVIDIRSSSLAWLEMFSRDARSFLRSKEAEKKEVTRLVNLGRGRYQKFIGVPTDHPTPAFGLADIPRFLSILDVEQQIKALRRLVADYDLGMNMQGAVLFYRPEKATHGEFATLYPQKFNNSNGLQERHRRWVCPIRKRSVQSDALDEGTNLQIDTEAIILRTIELMRSTCEPCGMLPDNIVTDGSGASIESHWKQTFAPHSQLLRWKYHSGSVLDLPGLQRYCARKGFNEEVTTQFVFGWNVGSSRHQYEGGKFKYLFGSESLRVYQPVTDFKQSASVPLLPLDFLSSALSFLPEQEPVMLQHFGLKKYIGEHLVQTQSSVDSNSPPYIQSLANLYQASLVYSRMPSATIDPAIASHPLHLAKWGNYDPVRSAPIEVRTKVHPKDLGLQDSTRLHTSDVVEEPKDTETDLMPSRNVALALIAAFDSGGIQVDPEDFKDVIAISSGDSLYVSEFLLNDPSSTHNTLRCLVGNIGKPGMTLMLSPQDPIVKIPDAEVWEMINHNDFDGRWEDNFRGTSMHLKLTGYEMPINIGQHGGRYREVIYAEAVVSAHSHGQWVADINVLGLYNIESAHGQTWLEKRLIPPSCHHSTEERDSHSEFGLLTSIDNWPELLDRPPNTSIIRAKGNWDARLAVSAVMHMRNDNAVIATGNVCWACVGEIASVLNMDLQQLLVLC